jgi:hypothetical protein
VFIDARVEGCSRARALLAAWAFAFLTTGTAHADLIVGAGSTTTAGSGVIDLACTDLIVAGTFQVASGTVQNVRNVTIQPGGTIDGGSGVIQLSGNWTDNGSFVANTGEVDFRDVCGPGPATISGNTTFFRASFVSGTGKNYVFTVGSTQTILSLLQIAGTAPSPIQFRSSTPGQVANINLVAAGTQVIQHVGVTDVYATGQHLAPNLTNEGGGGNAHGWFGRGGGDGGRGRFGSAAPIPTIDVGALIALAALLAATGLWFVRRATMRRHQGAVPTRATRARHEDRP